MRLLPLLFALTVAAPPALAQDGQPSSPQPPASARQDSSQAPTNGQAPAKDPEKTKDQEPGLPVSLDKIRDGLQQPPSALTLRSLDETPTFRMQILEKQKIEELLATLFLKTSPGPFGGYTPGGGLYGFEQQRQMFPAVDNPLRQPYAAFSGGELLTILIENLVGRYLAGRAMDAISNAERTRAEAAAKEEVRNAVTQYCAAQPNAGAGLQICGTTIR
jgi:hypothetical protein